MFKFVKEKILGIKPVFKIKIEKSWFSDDWFCIKFSKNNGWKWENILSSTLAVYPDFPGQMEIEIKYLSTDSIMPFAQSLRTYEDCVNHNNTIRKDVATRNRHLKKKYIDEAATTGEQIKRFNNSF